MEMIRVDVIDARDGGTLPGVAVSQLNAQGQPTGQGDVTDVNGVIQVAPGRYLFELLGYGDQDVQVNAPGTVQMNETPETLDEFTVYGERQRSNWPLWLIAAAVTLDQR